MERTYFTYQKKTNLEKFQIFVYDPSKNSFCGRTCKSWGLIFVFYVVFYLCLAGLFSGCFMVFYNHILPADHPTYYYKNEHNFFAQPGMTFVPQDKSGQQFHLQMYQLITFEPSNPASYAGYVNQLREIMQEYSGEGNRTVQSCSLVNNTEPCDLSPDQFEPECWDSSDPTNFKFGYDVGSPCMIFRLNKLYNWTPDEANQSSSDPGNRWESGRIPLACRTFRARTGDLTYAIQTSFYPSGGFPASCFPFCSRRTDYKSPIAMVKFTNLTRDVTMSVECQFYTANVNRDRQTGTGTAAFQIQVRN